MKAPGGGAYLGVSEDPMAEQESPVNRIKGWVGDGLLSPDQAQAISAYEDLTDRRRITPRRISLYLAACSC